MAEKTEPNLMIVRRSFPSAQEVFSSMSPEGADVRSIEVGWHGTGVYPEDGAVAVVRIGGPLTDLVGEVLRVGREGVPSDLSTPVYVWCMGEAECPADLSLTRRAFLAFAPLSHGRTQCLVEIVE